MFKVIQSLFYKFGMFKNDFCHVFSLYLDLFSFQF